MLLVTVAVGAHVPGHAAAKATQLKDEAYVALFPKDLFYLLAVKPRHKQPHMPKRKGLKIG